MPQRDAAATVRYISDDTGATYQSPDAIGQDEAVDRVEVSYSCPHCAGPNKTTYRRPTAGMLELTCGHCGYTVELFRGTPSQIEHPVTSYETIPDRIEALRTIRIEGEQEDSVTYQTFRRRRYTAFVLGSLATLPFLVPTGWIIITSQSPLFFLTSILAGLSGAVAYLFGRYHGLDAAYAWWNSMFDSNADLYERGLKRQANDVSLDEPMHEDADVRIEEE